MRLPKRYTASAGPAFKRTFPQVRNPACDTCVVRQRCCRKPV
ncbi:hypothetical protein [Mycolicibacter minnesotensis]